MTDEAPPRPTPDRGHRHAVVIGGQRCGTSFLMSVLARHPRVSVATPSRPEPKVFCSDEVTARGAAWYRGTYFPHAGGHDVLVEKSTSYIESATAPARVREVLGAETRVLALVRDPVARAVSNWRYSTDNGRETRSLERALAENLTGPEAWDAASSSVSPYAYLERGRYSDHLAPWIDAFPESLTVRFTADVLRRTEERRDVLSWLGVDADVPGVLEAEGAEGAVNASRVPVEPLTPELVERLRAYYRDSDRRLRDIIGRDLSWPSEPERSTR